MADTTFWLLTIAYTLLTATLLSHSYHKLQNWIFPIEEKRQPVRVRILKTNGGNIIGELKTTTKALKTTNKFKVIDLDDGNYLEGEFPNLNMAVLSTQLIRKLNPEKLNEYIVSFALVEIGGGIRFLTTYKMDHITNEIDYVELQNIQDEFERLPATQDYEPYTKLHKLMMGKG